MPKSIAFLPPSWGRAVARYSIITPTKTGRCQRREALRSPRTVVLLVVAIVLPRRASAVEEMRGELAVQQLQRGGQFTRVPTEHAVLPSDKEVCGQGGKERNPNPKNSEGSAN